MTLTYWFCECTDDASAYNIRTKTRREALSEMKEYGPGRFLPPKKVSVEYADSFDLMAACMGETTGYWEV